MRRWLLLIASVLLTTTVVAQIPPQPPATCKTGEGWWSIADTSATLWVCTTPNAWMPTTMLSAQANFTGLQDNTFTTVLTISIPNSGISAEVQADIIGALGPGGTVGQYESSTGRIVGITITRVPNLSADVALSTLFNYADARIPGSTTISQATQLGPLMGAANATQTITLQYKVFKGGQGSNNHSASVLSTIRRNLGARISVY